MEIEIAIEELILEGFAPSEKYRIGEAVERELLRLFSESTRADQVSALSSRDVLDAGAFQMRSARGDVVGSQIAAQIVPTVFQRLPGKA